MAEKQDEITLRDVLMRGVEQVVPTDGLQELLERGQSLRVKLGVDPTGSKIHLGRAIQLWKLREFQDLGHQIILIIGDFTALVGDASDKQQRRPVLTAAQIADNMRAYTDQVGKILDMSKVEWRHNSEWLAKLTPDELVRLARLVTVNQMLARHNFKERYESNAEIGLDEFLYPLFQGYDSVAVKADIELGGTDQLFNLQVGRVLQKQYNQTPQVAMVTKMLFGLDGRKMSTSWGNVVNILDPPTDQFGKLMSMSDEQIVEYAELAARMNPVEIERLQDLHPRAAKALVAGRVVKLYHGATAAAVAKDEFERMFSQKIKPKDMPEVAVAPGQYSIGDLLIVANLAESKSEAKRLIREGGVLVDDRAPSGEAAEYELESGAALVLQKGKRFFVKILAQ